MAVVPVFVSSTFRDFHGERDILAGPVRERLDELVAPLGMRVELIDLRWGVNTIGVTEEQAAQHVLDVCLAEVKRARPLFLGLVGDRLGYVPAAIHARSVATSAGVPESQPVDGLSVTALEFGFGLLWDSAPTGDHFVVFRNVIGEPPADWSEADPNAVQAFRSEVAEYARGRDDVVVAEYQAHVSGAAADLESVTTAGATISFEDLIVELMSEPVQRRAKQLSDEQADAGWSGSERLFRDDHAIIVGRDALVDQIVDIASAGGKVVAVGESGSGKSTVVCAAEAQLRAQNIPVISSLLGASTAGASGRLLVEDLVGQIGLWTGRDISVPADLDVDGLAQWWRDMLHETVSTAGHFVIVVDALDAFVGEPERSDVWPVRGLPPAVGLVTSTTVTSHAQILEHAGATRIAVDELPGPTAAEAADAWSSASKRELPTAVLDHIGQSPRVPLWVRLAVDLVGDLDGDDFASIAHITDQAQAIADLLTDRAQGLPASTQDLVGVFLDTVAERLEPESASVLLGALAVSRSGLSPADLAALLPNSDAQVTVATLRRVLGGQLRESDPTGRLTFSHSIVRTAATQRAPEDIHARIVRVLDADNAWDSSDALDVVWHAIDSSDPDNAAPLARALNQASASTLLTLMRALQAHPAGIVVINALNSDHLDTSGMLALLAADQSWSAEHLGLRSRTRYSRRALELTRATAHRLGQRNTMLAAGNLGAVLTAAGELPTARAAYTESLTTARELAAAQPDALQPRRDITISLNNIGDVAVAMGDLPTARTAYTESLTISRDLAAAQPDALQPRRDITFSLNNIGDVAVAMGDLPAARTAYTESLALARDLAAAQPDALQPRRDLSISLDNIGRAADAMGDLPTARTAYTESLTIRRDLAAAQPDALQSLQDLAYSLNAVAQTSDETNVHALQLEERSTRITIFNTLRDYWSALTLIRLDLKIDAYISEHPTSDPNSPVHPYHQGLLKETESLLVMLDNAKPLPDDLRSELTRVRRTLAELEAAEQNPKEPNTEADPQ